MNDGQTRELIGILKDISDTLKNINRKMGPPMLSIPKTDEYYGPYGVGSQDR